MAARCSGSRTTVRRIGVQPGGQEQVEILGHVGARRDLKRRSPPLVQPRCRLKMPPCAAQCDTRTRCATLDVEYPAVPGLDDPPPLRRDRAYPGRGSCHPAPLVIPQAALQSRWRERRGLPPGRPMRQSGEKRECRQDVSGRGWSPERGTSGTTGQKRWARTGE